VRSCGGVRGCVREAGGRRHEGLCEGGWAEKKKKKKKKVRRREGGRR
jgi:hypothetical protein